MWKRVGEFISNLYQRVLYLSEWKLYAWCLAFVVLLTLPTMTWEKFKEAWSIHVFLCLFFARITMMFVMFWCRVHTVLERLGTLMQMKGNTTTHEELEYCRTHHMKYLGHTKENYPFVALFCRPAFLGVEKFIRDMQRFNDEENECEEEE